MKAILALLTELAQMILFVVAMNVLVMICLWLDVKVLNVLWHH